MVRQPDVILTLFAADLLITDASSVANEYALLDRPIVFLDVPELLAAAGGEGSAPDLETWGRRAARSSRDRRILSPPWSAGWPIPARAPRSAGR